MFVAPVTVGDGAYTGAGTVMRRDVPPGALAVSGGPQRNLEGWVLSRRPGTGRGRQRQPDAREAECRRHDRARVADREPADVRHTEEEPDALRRACLPELAEEVAKHLNVAVTPQSAYDFANGEIFVRFEESVRGCDAFVHPEPHARRSTSG